MKLQTSILFIFLIPTLTYGLNQQESSKILNQVSSEWNRHNEEIKQFQKSPHTEEGLRLIRESLACCERAAQSCDAILNDIAGQSKSKRKEKWRVELKSRCEKDKQGLNAEIDQLRIDVKRVEANISAISLYNTALEKVLAAQSADRDCQRGWNNTDAVVLGLNEATKLCEEAFFCASQALALLDPYPQEEDKANLRRCVANYQEMAEKYKKEALEWPATSAAKKATCREKIRAIKSDSQLLTEKGLKRSGYELQKQAFSLMEELLDGNDSEEVPFLKEEQAELKASIAAFEKEADENRLTAINPSISKEFFESVEKERQELFFNSDLLLHPDRYLSETITNTPLPRAVPLDGQIGQKQGDFTLYTDQWYRFLIQSAVAETELVVTVLEQGQVVDMETITLPIKNSESWEKHLKEGMVFIPDTKLKSDFGLELRLSFAADPENIFALVVSQKSTDLHYQFAISLGQKAPLYVCQFMAPPPWQLETLKKPASVVPNDPVDSGSLPSMDEAVQGMNKQICSMELTIYPVLDQFVEELKKDPLALASFVQNEVALVDPFLHQENGELYPPAIYRNPAMTFLEKQGSVWEQCQLLVYLLRKAGFQAAYALGESSSLPVDFVERLLLTQFPQDQKEALLKYPWVVFFDGTEWLSLFPWMKEIQVREGHDLYSFLPEKYATADRWILQYLKGDEAILKHIGPDGDDTAGVLFVRFLEESLRKQGLSLDDVGIHRTQLKKQFASWKDFPHPKIPSKPVIYHSPPSGTYARMHIEIASRQNPQKRVFQTIPVALLSSGLSFIRFAPNGNQQTLLAEVAGNVLPELQMEPSDQTVDISVWVQFLLGTKELHAKQTYSINKGTSAALCAHFGTESSKVTSQYYEQFRAEQNEKKRVLALLSFVGASYFEKCSRATNRLAALHKVNPTVPFAFGLAKLSPDLSKGPFRGEEDLVLPQVDMFCFHVGPLSSSIPSVWHQERHTARVSFEALSLIDGSSNEHQILKEVFKDAYAVSTVKLLQLAHLEQQKKGLEGDGFLTLTRESFETTKADSEAKTISPWQWNTLQTLMDPNDPWSCWTYAYMTPGLVSSLDGTRKEKGTIILSPRAWYALISINDLVTNGGLGSPLPRYYLTPWAIRNWELLPTAGSHTGSWALSVPTQPNSLPVANASNLGTKEWSSDVRPWYKTILSYVADPIDTVTGAFYLDETDLVLPGPFPLSIRRNYNSQNPLISNLGCGWKLSLNPFLVDQDGKRFAAELDGTVIVYSHNQQSGRWEVLPENNPELCNCNQQEIGGSASPFHSYIENDILYGSDGSKRFYKEALLEKWVDARGNTLRFLYQDERLSRIESSNEDFCGIHYNHEGNISEIYAKDGRRICYDYDSQGDLVTVTLPNTAKIGYTYDRHHRIIRETKPHGRVLENIYDDEGRVKQQRSPMGLYQEMVTSATFEYADGKTVVTDAAGGKTTYQIHDKQIYKITDPLGSIILQAWFIDQESWFNPETEQVVEWNQKSGAVRSLKSTTDKRGLTTSYLYDGRGNPKQIILEGEDLTGNGESRVVKSLVYNEQNLCIEEEVGGQKTVTTYDATFSYLPKKIERYSGTHLLSYMGFDYNSLGQLEKEDCSGSITRLKYNNRGFPRGKIQITGTEDPDLVTTYAYNQQGQCIKITSADAIQENEYDLMGNPILSKTLSPSGELITAIRIGYDLNNTPVWKQTANAENVVYLDYHASGLVKAKRQKLAPSRLVAYTLYEYNPAGYLIEETDPRGYVTYRDYDLLGRVKKKTKEDQVTLFSYEAGGLIETITSPSGAQLTRHYTSNGLPKEEIYPDGTKNTTVYDFFGRPVLETKNNITWEIHYDDAAHCVTKTHLETKRTEISEYDPRGNCIRFTDAAGYTSEKSYDGLNRPKTETSPSGKTTVWSYLDNRVICTRPNGETSTAQYAGGKLIRSEVTDATGTPIAVSEFHFDPKNDKEEITHGDKKTITWRNALGRPVKVEQGTITTQYEYDPCGNCIVSIDGDGRVTRQEFDGLNRLVQKQLSDGTQLKFVYDLDSNLSEYHLPNGNVWKASYDSMHRKKSEELYSSSGSSGQWTFSYNNGYLTETIDPMQRTHNYAYNSYGRLFQDETEGGSRTYTYEPRGYLMTADQTYGSEYSLVERSYDADGNLSLESIHLNSELIQQTRQEWTVNSRSLQIGDHVRNFTYQNNQLIQVSTPPIEIIYSYDLSGALKTKKSPFSSTTIDYNGSGLPDTLLIQLPEGAYPEQLSWYPSGKLSTHTAPENKQNFSYNERGYLTSTGSEKYEFDLLGVRTSAPGWCVPQDGLDALGRIRVSVCATDPVLTDYNAMGETIFYGQRQLFWDPWGRLTQVTDPSFTWEASYDAFGRRLKTRYTQSGKESLITTSFYDPEKKFQEIGVQMEGKTFWKINGPDGCDAVSDETGVSLTLVHNALRQLIGIVSSQGTLPNTTTLSAYGPIETAPPIPTNLLSYAQSLSWQSRAQDPTGFIWMGDRYYDPIGGRFLSQDPVSYPLSLDLYAYANGDPINYFDPDGRFASAVYQANPPVTSAYTPWQQLTTRNLNILSFCCTNFGLTRSSSYEVGSFDLSSGGIGFINGINNTQKEAMASATRLSEYAGGAKIHGIYNATNLGSNRYVSTGIDVVECLLGQMGMRSPPTYLVKEKWAHFFATHGPEEKFLQGCHSGGALPVYHALLTSSESVRQRIIVLALAPAVIIPEELCFRSYNYISGRDIVTHLDIIGKSKYGDQLRILEPDPEADFWDHDFLSPTFKKPIKDHIQDYIESGGGKNESYFLR